MITGTCVYTTAGKGRETQGKAGDGTVFVWRSICIALVLILAVGCKTVTGKGEIVVPDRPTAKEQAQVANRQFQAAGETIDRKLRNDEFEKAEAALEAVVRRFPNDRVYTPPSHLALAQSRMEMERFAEAESAFAEVVRLYPEVPDVNAAALYGLAQSLKKQNKIRQEKEALRKFIDLYESSGDKAIASRVAAAKRQYDEVQRK